MLQTFKEKLIGQIQLIGNRMALGLSVATMETKGNNALNSEEKINFNLEICTQAKCDNRTKTFQPQKLF